MRNCPLDWLTVNGTMARWRVFSSCEFFNCDGAMRRGCVDEFLSRARLGLEMLEADEKRRLEDVSMQPENAPPEPL